MKIRYYILMVAVCFCTVLQAQNRADELMKQAQSSLETKEYTKARYLFIQAYRAFAEKGEYVQATECGTKASSLYYRENYYKEAFELCRQMTQYLLNEEQKAQKILYDQRFSVTKERLQMYIQLKNLAQAQVQLDELDNLAKQASNDKLSEELLYTQANFYYTFGQNEKGDSYFQKLTTQYKENKEYDKVNECYKNLIAIARKANNAPLMERTYEKYIVWTDSVKALTAEDKLGALQQKYDSSLQTIQEKDKTLAGKQYMIIGLFTFAIVVIIALVLVILILLRFIIRNRKLKKIIKTTNEHNEQQTKFIQNISAQMEPTLENLSRSVEEVKPFAPEPAKSIEKRIDALKLFSKNIQELSTLETSLLETYEKQPFNVGKFCNEVMDKVKDEIKPEVETAVDAPQLEIKTNAEQLERILVHLLKNAALYTSSGKIRLEFKKKGAHLCQFIISDNGPGIPDEQKDNIFKPFKEIKDLAEGDGLGLPICSLIASKMNGNLTIDAEYNKGCRFILALQV
ncbi:sensor histidine kinase [Parabacteroides bouchesdurhonensis]|uniref:sensor histidine kinase n=1 Tax=Parabacteroides bouchesdurhonensis TaxID=1936995 RepID=UPI000C849B89|nr:HAMP domain-containing sensor histidine kinase [Parabacteroides bouchesdurhonensis]